MVTYMWREAIEPLIFKLSTISNKALSLKLHPLYFQVSLNRMAGGHNIIYGPSFLLPKTNMDFEILDSIGDNCLWVEGQK